jgi:hypothetical protein
MKNTPKQPTETYLACFRNFLATSSSVESRAGKLPRLCTDQARFSYTNGSARTRHSLETCQSGRMHPSFASSLQIRCFTSSGRVSKVAIATSRNQLEAVAGIV